MPEFGSARLRSTFDPELVEVLLDVLQTNYFLLQVPHVAKEPLHDNGDGAQLTAWQNEEPSPSLTVQSRNVALLLSSVPAKTKRWSSGHSRP